MNKNRFINPYILSNFFNRELIGFITPLMTPILKSDVRNELKKTQKKELVYQVSEYVKTSKTFEDEKKVSAFKKVIVDNLTQNHPDTVHLYPITFDVDKLENMPNKIMNLDYRRLDHSDYTPKLIYREFNKTENTMTYLFDMGLTSKVSNSSVEVVFTITCVIDFDKSFLSLKYYQPHLSKYRVNENNKTRGIIHSILAIIKPQFNLSLTYTLAEKTKEIVYNMFKYHAEQADEKITEHLEKQRTSTEEQIPKGIEVNQINAINNLTEIFTVKEFKERVKKRIQSMILEETALTMLDKDFDDNYIYAFSFHDGLNTKSSTKDTSKKHIYQTNSYWLLKDIIHEKMKMHSLSLSKSVNLSNNTSEAILYTISSGLIEKFKQTDNESGKSNTVKNTTLKITIENSNAAYFDKNRGEKFEFLTQDVIKYLS